MAGLMLVDALEGSGWRLVTDRARGRHVLDEPEPVPVEPPFVPDPDAVTPPSGEFRVPNVVR